ncbi:hypothetical protein MMC10_010463 [Thelotrema lepadinum]|nr:hypothetical protein [Thelotrema lepadinum]
MSQSNQLAMRGSEGANFLDLPLELREEIYEYYLFPTGDRNPKILTTLLTWDSSLQPKAVDFHGSLETSLFRHSDSCARLYSFLLLTGKENRSFIRFLSIQLSGKAEDLYTNNAVSSFLNRGSSISRVIDLLSRGHTLRSLSLIFDNDDLLLAFLSQTELTQALSRVRGVKSLTMGVSIRHDRVIVDEKRLQEIGLWNTFQDVVKKVETPLSPEELPESTDNALSVIGRAEKRAREILALADAHRKLLASHESAKKDEQHHQEMQEKARESASVLMSRATAVEAEMERFANAVVVEPQSGQLASPVADDAQIEQSPTPVEDEDCIWVASYIK